MNFIDGHCDTVLRCYNDGISFQDGDMHLNYQKMQDSKIMLQYFALFIESKYKPYYALEQALTLISYFKKCMLPKFPDLVLIKTNKDLELFGKKKLAGKPLNMQMF